MTTDMSTTSPSPESVVVVRAVTAIIGTVVALTFMFGFGNVLNLALRLGVPVWVAPLVAPAVDLSVIGLLLGTRYLALAGASSAVLGPARRLLIFASVVTLALNVADPLVAGDYGKAAFDAVGPLLLIGWAEVGPGFLQAIGQSGVPFTAVDVAAVKQPEVGEHVNVDVVDREVDRNEVDFASCRPGRSKTLDELLEQARREDAEHRMAYQKPVSADTLRVRLGVGTTRARHLIKIVRAEYQASVDRRPGGRSEGTGADRAAA
jgi:hypothetical protein